MEPGSSSSSSPDPERTAPSREHEPTRRRRPGLAARIGWPGRRWQPLAITTRGRPVVVFGDLHLTTVRPDTRNAALDFIARLNASNAAAAICLGDLFEAYFGEHYLKGPDGEIVRAFADLRARGVPAALIPGNRDFLAGRDLDRHGLPVWRDWMHLQIDQHPRRVAITHGDLLMHHDSSYQMFRGIVHSPFFRTGSAFVPDFVHLAIGRFLRWNSLRRHRRYAQQPAQQPASTTPATGRTRYRGAPGEVVGGLFGFPDAPATLVCGHFHNPGIEPWPPDHQLVTVGDWHPDGGTVALIWSPFDVELRHSATWP